jgi:hypothetical protein
MYVIARSAVPDSQNILTIGIKLRIIDQKWNITKLLKEVIFKFIHVKDISKVNDNGNQYKQKLILWYWTKNYF